MLKSFNATMSGPSVLAVSGVTADAAANAVYPLADAAGVDHDRIWQAVNGYQIAYDTANSRWTVYNAAGTPAALAYQSTADADPWLGAWSGGAVAIASVELCAATTGKEIAIVSIEIAAAADGGEIILSRHFGGHAVFVQKLTVGSGESVVFDHKIFLPAGYSLRGQSSVSDVMIAVNASEDEV